MSISYQPVIGLEIHAQLQTNSKIFASDPVLFGQEANTLISPISLGHPGTLPYLNKKVVEFAIKMGLAIGSEIAPQQYFDRKNYFYPDLPKGYQITQDKTPICVGGSVLVHLKDGDKRLEFHHIHLEEDAGKSLHEGDNPFSFLDYNRAGTPLIEMVTEPTIHSSEEAFALVSEVRKLVRYLGICDGNMEEGSLRADVNVSIRPVGTTALGTKVEIKNMNSLRNIQRAIEHEIVRQTKVLNEGGSLIQETRTFDAHTGLTHSMRVKETMNDYRYFPEPDLVPVAPDAQWIEKLRAGLPERPSLRRKRLQEQWSVPDKEMAAMINADVLNIVEETVLLGADPTKARTWWLGEISRIANDKGVGVDELSITPAHVAELINLVASGELTDKLARQVVEGVVAGEGTPSEVVAQRGIKVVNDDGALMAAIEKVCAAQADTAEKVRGGHLPAAGALIGAVMKETAGQADAAKVRELLLKYLGQ